jgi:putative ATP-binding cassette transporter
MFVPRRPCAASGRLRDLLLDGLGRDTPDDRLRAVLGEVGLGEVVAREGGLDAERDWSEVLSPGELLCLAFARLLLAEPRFAFLDDPAAALDRAQELGGKTVMPPTEIPGVVTMAQFLDPAGNLIGLIKS